MDKSWMVKIKTDPQEYFQGIERFLDFAFENSSNNGKILCPCTRCGNCDWRTRNEVKSHLLFRGIIEEYTTWYYHGESLPLSSESPFVVSQETPTDFPSNMHHLLHDAFGFQDSDEQVPNEVPGEHDMNNEGVSGGDTYTGKDGDFRKFFEDADKSLYPGCKFSILSFVVHLLHIKSKNQWSDKSVDMLLQLLKEVFPYAKMPSSFYEAKKVINKLGLVYEKIHACPNNCTLYWGERAEEQACWKCETSRWKSDGSEKKIPAKVLRYFPLIPRLQRLYMSSKTSSLMRWHDEGRKKDGILRHPADSLAWKSFDERYPDFANDLRNVKLGMTSDGFNPSGAMSNSYSIWPVILIPYNLPPWMCMKQDSLILSMIIPGEKGPGDNIDVFLQPLIAELLQLWQGVKTYDATSKEYFTMRAALMWTINDFPAYAYLSGWSTQGKQACPCCANNTESRWLKNGGKYCYLGHRRWLSPSHKFRKQKHLFDGTEEQRPLPIPMSGCTALSQLEGVDFKFNIRDCENVQGKSWRKKSILFKLPYWEFQMLRHNLDVMHIEKNVCENVIGTMLNIGKKKVDNKKSRDDLAIMGIRHNMHIKIEPNGKEVVPPACYHLSKKEINEFLKVLEDVKLPDGYVSNISRGVNKKERKIQSLKSHDYHILMQDLLPIALRSFKNDEVVKAITELSAIFKGVCSKSLHVEELERLESCAALTLCKMEMIFPPSFFTIMVHLVIHILGEAKVAGPVQYRWMYPIERREAQEKQKRSSREEEKLKRRREAHWKRRVFWDSIHDICLQKSLCRFDPWNLLWDLRRL